MSHYGDYFIIAAAFSALASLVSYFLWWRGRDQFQTLARGFYLATATFVVGALGLLLYLILTHDYTVAYVYSYSSNDLPFGYLISSLWGGQEGTFLLWLFFTSVLGIIMMRTAREFEKGNMFFLNLFLISLLLILIKKSPFELSPVFREDGAGLNPLLQNFWMQIHPPIMFIGFSGAVFPFCFAMTALVERKFQTWSEAARRWTMFAWASLGVSLVMGGYWAYETLGWGGFWAWDPVENSSFIPWIFLTAQVHSLFIKRQRRGLMRFSMFVVCLTFWSVLYGTFLTRSGVLADFSVHSFVDLGINNFLVGGLATFVILGATLLAVRWREIRPEPSFSKVNSRSYLVTLGVVILFVGGVLVLLGTSAPLLTRFSANPSNVGLPYYFATMTPIAIAILLLITLFPVYRWNQGMAKPRLLMIGGGVAMATVITMIGTGYTYNPMYLLLYAFASSALIVNGYVFLQSWRDKQLKPGYLSHVGLSIALIGAATANGFETKETIKLIQNVPVNVMGYTLNFTQVMPKPKGFDCHVVVSHDNSSYTAVLAHEFPKNQDGVMKKPHVESHLAYDLYLSPASFEPAQGNDPGEMMIKKGESKSLDKYQFTFQRFEMGGHDAADSNGMTAAAIVTVAYDGKSEEIRPVLRVKNSEITPVMASFDSNAGQIFISGVRPEEGGVLLKVAGSFVPPGSQGAASLVVELSKKPLIIMFWLGALITFSGGLLSMRQFRRRRNDPAISTTPLSTDPTAAVSVAS